MPERVEGKRSLGAAGGVGKVGDIIRRLLLAVLAIGLLGRGAVAGAQDTTSSAPPPQPKAWILVDADTGIVIDGVNHREALPVASLSKIVTALAVAEVVPPGTGIPVSLRAEGMPARKINMKAGQTWTFEDTLASMMLSSANDAAVALAERVSGSVEAFADELGETADHIGLEDDPVLQDPAGLDDEFSVGGGNLLSARDLAIATRALLANQRVADVVAMPEYRFFGGDGIHHRLVNHNRMLRTYPGAIGVKTGYTKRSGRCLVAAARRDGRTMIAVVIDVYDIYGFAAGQLDRGFATPPGLGAATADHLPEVPAANVPSAEELSAARTDPSAPVRTPLGEDVRSYREELTALGGVLAIGFLWARAQRRRVWRAKQARRRARLMSEAGPAARRP